LVESKSTSLAYDESKAEDVLFVIDGSRSMGGKLKSAGMSKMKMVKEGLMGFVTEHWPISYFPWPLRVGITFYRLLGTPGSAVMDVVVPLNPPPATLELYRLNDMPTKGGSPLVDAVRYSFATMADSIRNKKSIKLVSDGGNDGDPISTMSEELASAPVKVDTIELSNSASKELRDLARITGGSYARPSNMADFEKALRK
jgi:Mg-chelatase subunit ChlD